MRRLLPLLCILLLAAGVVHADDTKPEVIKKGEAEKPALKKAPNPVVLLKIQDYGTVEIELFPDAAPMTVKNFIDLAEGKKEWTHPVTKEKSKRPFFDGLKFHRVIADFMLQGGDPAANGSGGPGYFFKDEINAKGLGLDKLKLFTDPKKGLPHHYVSAILNPRNPRLHFQKLIIEPLLKKLGIPLAKAQARAADWQPKLIAMTLKEAYELQGYKYDDSLTPYGMKRGFIAMANSGANTNGSQFFINVKDNDYLSGKHTVFGKVIKGMEVVDTVSKVKTEGPQTGRPLKDVVIDFVRLKK